MWASFASNALSTMGLMKNSRKGIGPPLEGSDDDEVCSNGSAQGEGLDCPICWESFNIVENVPYVLWCGHTLCQNCVLGLQSAVVRIPPQQIRIPFFISCPWCHSLSLRVVLKGALRFPCKNFFVLWMVERLNGGCTKFGGVTEDNQPAWSTRSNLFIRNQGRNGVATQPLRPHCPQQARSPSSSFSLNSLLDYMVHLTSKFPLVFVLLLIVFFIVPASAVILLFYLLLTVLFAFPSMLVLYSAFPTLDRLMREITS